MSPLPSSLSPGSDASRIQAFQILRGLAALGVLIHHATRAVTVNNHHFEFGMPWLVQFAPLRDFGAVGVDLFFVLSGFLMMHVAGQAETGFQSSKRFWLRRFWRIWPPYALVTLVLCLVILLRYLMGDSAGENVPYNLQWQRLLGFFFIPSFDNDGVIQPILTVGWTLSYEALFYLVFGLCLLGQASLRPTLLALVLGALMLFSGWFPERSVAAIFLGNTILFEFLMGVAVAVLWQQQRLNAPWMKWLWLPGLLVLVASTTFDVPYSWRFLASGSGAVLVLIAFLNVEKAGGYTHWVQLGDASYSLYLVHIPIIYTLGFRIINRFSADTLRQVPPDIVALIMILASLITGWLFFRWVEQPLLSRLRGGQPSS